MTYYFLNLHLGLDKKAGKIVHEKLRAPPQERRLTRRWGGEEKGGTTKGRSCHDWVPVGLSVSQSITADI